MSGPPAPKTKRRLWATVFLSAYVTFIAAPIWYRSARVPRAPLPYDDIVRLEQTAGSPLAGALPVTITAYLICTGRGYPCLQHPELSVFAQQLGAAVLEEAGLGQDQAPLAVRVIHDTPGSCAASSWEAPGGAAFRAAAQRQWPQWRWEAPGRGPLGGGGAGSDCMDLAGSGSGSGSAVLQKTVMAGTDRDFDDWAAKELGGQDRPGNYHLFIVPDPWLAATAQPYGSVGRHRTAFVRFPAAQKPTHESVVRLAALLAAPAFASQLGGSAPAAGRVAEDDVGEGEEGPLAQRLPLSPAAQLHLSFSLCNAHPSPNGGTAGGGAGVGGAGGGGAGRGPPGASAAAAAAAAFAWDFARFETQFVAPVKHVLAPAARLTVSSQVLYFTPGRVNASWSPSHRTYVLPHSQLPFFLDSSWPLDPGRTGLPASADGGGTVPYDVATVPAGSRTVAIGEALSQALPQAGAAGRAAGEALAAAERPWLLPPPAAESLPPAVLHFVLYAPQPWQRPLMVLGPDGQAAPANSFTVPGWGMLQVLNQVPGEGLLLAPVDQEAMETFAVEFVTQLRALLGLSAARRRLLLLGPQNSTSTNTTHSVTAGATASPPAASAAASSVPAGYATLLTALRTGLAPWEVDALVRRRCREDVAAAAATLGSLARLLRQVPTLSVPRHVGLRVRDAVAAVQRALRYAAEGRYEETSRAAQEGRSWAEAAFADPSLSARLNVPDTHLVGVYLPFCLPAAVPLLQALFYELRRRRIKAAEAAAAKKGTAPKRGTEPEATATLEPLQQQPEPVPAVVTRSGAGDAEAAEQQPRDAGDSSCAGTGPDGGGGGSGGDGWVITKKKNNRRRGQSGGRGSG